MTTPVPSMDRVLRHHDGRLELGNGSDEICSRQMIPNQDGKPQHRPDLPSWSREGYFFFLVAFFFAFFFAAILLTTLRLLC